MADDVRPDFDDEDDAIERGMTVAAWAVISVIALLAVIAACGWLHVMHLAGSGRWIW